MPVAKLNSSSYSDVMKSEEGNDSLDTIIRQAIGKEPFLSFSRAGESPVQWIQLLHALDQQELPGWPLLSPIKVQMQKCEKCTREFCSVINYRRHIRVHHRLKKLDKDFTKSRELLAAFWDKLSWEEEKEVVSFKNILFEGIQGSAIIKNLTALIGKPGFSALPHVYLRAGSALLDIVQGRPSRFPIPSQDLFEILDNASEKTFLCGTAVSMQKYVFDGEAAKIGLETKNLIACMSFLLEQKLIKAWLADKDAEALRCQKLLVEEEEAAQKRQADLLERKRQKKLRQKEQKSKEQRLEEKADVEVEGSADEIMEDVTPEEPSSPQTECPSERHFPDIFPDHIPFEAFQPSLTDDDEDSDFHSRFHSGYPDLSIDQNGEQQKVQLSGHKHVISQWQVLPKSQRGLPNGFRADQNYQGLKIGDMRRHGNHVQSRVAPVVNGKKVWSRKPKPERDGDRIQARAQEEATTRAEEIKSHEVLIGSISVALGNSNQESKDPAGAQDDCPEPEGHKMPKKINHLEKSIKPDSIQSGTNRVMVKLWRPVSRNGSKCPLPDQSENGESEAEAIAENQEDQILLNAYSPRSSSLDGDTENFRNNSSLQEENVRPVDYGLEFSSRAAKAFLAQRWKEAITADHVKLNLPSDSDSSGCLETQSDNENSAFQSSNIDKRNILGNAMSINVEPPKSSTNEAGKAKFRTKFEKGAKIKYIPKLRTAT